MTARAREFVDQHHLRSEDGALRLWLVAAIAGCDARQMFTRQALDDVGRERAAAVEPLVDNHRLLVDLCEEIAREVS
jgi:hypothetical protein